MGRTGLRPRPHNDEAMRDYDSGNWGFALVWGYRASVFPRAFVVALPNAVLAFGLSYVIKSVSMEDQDTSKHAFSIMALFTSVLTFVLYFRSNVAYSRWWEGGTLLQQVRGEWFNAYSSLIAFSSPDPKMAADVEKFHQLLARLMSLLFCSALQQVSPNKEARAFEIMDYEGIEADSLSFLDQSCDKVEIILQWIQRCTVLNMTSGVLPIPPPVISRAFQELSRGIVNLQNARKIADFPFPFPYAQTSMVMLLIHWFMCPVLTNILLNRFLAALTSFMVIFFLWCIHYIALQLESPFGDRDNDLPMHQMQHDWNKSVGTLLAHRAQRPPSFAYVPSVHRQLEMKMSDGSQLTKRRLTLPPSAVLHGELLEAQMDLEAVRTEIRSSKVSNNSKSRLSAFSNASSTAISSAFTSAFSITPRSSCHSSHIRSPRDFELASEAGAVLERVERGPRAGSPPGNTSPKSGRFSTSSMCSNFSERPPPASQRGSRREGDDEGQDLVDNTSSFKRSGSLDTENASTVAPLPDRAQLSANNAARANRMHANIAAARRASQMFNTLPQKLGAGGVAAGGSSSRNHSPEGLPRANSTASGGSAGSAGTAASAGTTGSTGSSAEPPPPSLETLTRVPENSAPPRIAEDQAVDNGTPVPGPILEQQDQGFMVSL